MSYTVHYKEQGTENAVANDKVVNSQTFGEQVTENAVDVEGYEKVAPTSTNIEITTGTNEYTFYYTKRTDLSYTVNYLEKETNKALNTAKTVNNKTYQEEIQSATEVIEIDGYTYDSVNPSILTIGAQNSQNIINIYYTKASLGYTVHYFYDGIEDETKKETKQAKYQDTISTYPDKAEGHTFIEAKATDENGHLKTETITESPLVIGLDGSKNKINVYYKTAYTVKATVKNNKGGTAKNEAGDPAVETVLYGETSKEKIILEPNTGYDAVSLIIYTENIDGTKTEEELDINTFIDSNGVITLPKGYFQNVRNNKEVVVEFKKKTSVIVKYLDKDTNESISTNITIIGYEGDEYTPESKVIAGYRQAKVQTNDGTKSSVTFENKDKFDVNQANKMKENPVTVVFWYEQVPEGTLTVKHIEIDENDIKQGLTLISGIEIEEKVFNGTLGKTETVERKQYIDTETSRKYVSANGPASSDENIIIVGKDKTNHIVTYEENESGVIEPQEVRFYYVKQYNVIAKIKEHTETVEEAGTLKEVQVKGGTILDVSSDVPFEIINKKGTNTKAIKIKPDANYKVKTVKVNGSIISLEGKEDAKGVVTLEKGYFTNVTEDKEIEVEFEKIPSKVIVKYVDKDTNKEIVPEKTINGYVGDNYSEERVPIEGYEEAGQEPENRKGKIAKEPVTVIFYYAKQYEIKTEVKMHEETRNGQTVKVKGGTISGDGEIPYEIVTKGNSSTKEIVIKEEAGYRIRKVTINTKEVEVTKKQDGTYIIPTFENITENKNVQVEFERITAKVRVEYVEILKEKDEKTGKEIEKERKIVPSEEIKGYLNEEYKTNAKELEYYQVIKTKLPENRNGIMKEDEVVVKYYYEKLPFNLKVQKDIYKVVLDGKEQKITDINKAKIEIKYKNINEVKLEISYKIRVTNDAKLAGKAILEEIIPEGFMFVLDEEGKLWAKEQAISGEEAENKVEKYMLETEEIKPGETKEYTVTLRWVQEALNKGTKVNVAQLARTINKPNFAEAYKEDNKDEATIEIILTEEKEIKENMENSENKNSGKESNLPQTGQARILYIVLSSIAVASMGAIGVVTYKIRKKE